MSRARAEEPGPRREWGPREEPDPRKEAGPCPERAPVGAARGGRARAAQSSSPRIRSISTVCWATTSLAISSTKTSFPSVSASVAMVIAPW